MNPHTYTPPDNGGFIIPYTGDRVLLCLVTDKNRWEIPGGGEEPEDNGNLLNTAIREAHEEALVNIFSQDTTLIGNLVQVIPGTNGKTGTAGLWSTQVFTPITGHYWNQYKLRTPNHVYTHTKESSAISLVRLRDIFWERSSLVVPLGHKRMLLHALNSWARYTPLPEGTRLGQPVTAEVPHLGKVTC